MHIRGYVDAKGRCFFLYRETLFLPTGTGTLGQHLVFIWPDQASVPVSQCPSDFGKLFGVAMLLGISESLCSSEFRSRYAPRNFGVAITLDHSPPLKWISKVGPLSMDLAIDVIDLAGAPIRMRASWTSLMSSPEYRAMTPPLAESIHRGGARPPAAFGIGTERGATRKRWSRSVSASLGDVGTLMTRVSAY
jgi:hypothetical protein